jgi:DNA-binding beta-propeller fold protein YncE
MGRRLLALLLVVAGGCTETPEDPCDACHPRPPSTLFVTDRDGDQVLRYNGVTGQFIDVFAQGAEQHLDRPSNVRLGPSGHVYLAGFGRGDVVRYDVTSGAMMDVFYWDTTLLEEPVELMFRGSELLVLGHDTQNLAVIDRDGHAVRELGYPLMRGAHDFVLSPDESTIYVATEHSLELGTSIQAWDVASGTLLATFGQLNEVAFANGIALRDNGQLYVADYERNQIVRFDAASGAALATTVTSDSGLLDAPVSLEFGPDGALYVLDAVGIHRMDPETGLELSLLVEVNDGHNLRPRNFTFATQTAIAEAIAKSAP